MASPFLEQLKQEMRLRGYSERTVKSYITWRRQFIFFTERRHPREMGAEEVTAFLSHLANERHVAVNTQKVALNALVFMYHKVLKRELGDLGFTLATRQRNLPTVLTPDDIAQILSLPRGPQPADCRAAVR